MKPNVKISRQCAIAFGSLFALLMLVGLLLVWPWWSKNSQYDQQAESRAKQLTKFRTLAAQQPNVEAELALVKQSAGKTQYYISADTSALGAAELQKLVKRIIDANNGKLISTQAMPIQDDGKTLRIVIRVRMSLKLDTLAEVLHGLEGGRPLLFIENLSIRSQKRRGRRVRGKTTTPLDYNLDVRYDLVGYMKEATG